MLYPMMVKMEGKKCVVFGGGDVALRKCAEVLKCGAQISVHAKTFSDSLIHSDEDLRLVETDLLGVDGHVDLKGIEEALKGCFLCFTCTDDRALNQAIADYCHEAGIWVNVSDAHGDSSFIVPSIRRKGDIVLSVYSSENPAASRFIADQLQATIHQAFLDFTAHTREIRQRLKLEGVACSIRQSVMKRIFFDGPAERAFSQSCCESDQAKADADAILDEALDAERRKKEGESHR